jgi:hypothetical protein
MLFVPICKFRCGLVALEFLTVNQLILQEATQYSSYMQIYTYLGHVSFNYYIISAIELHC